MKRAEKETIIQAIAQGIACLSSPTGQQQVDAALRLLFKAEKIMNGDTEELVWPAWAGPMVKQIWAEFLDYRYEKDKHRYKSVKTEQRAINLLAKYYHNGRDCYAGIEECMARGWLFPVDPGTRGHGATGVTPTTAPINPPRTIKINEQRDAV